MNKNEKETICVLGFDMETDIGSWTPFLKGIEEGTEKLLSLLGRKNVQATFFWVGDVAEKYPDKVKLVERSGHETGCHSLFHETLGDSLFTVPGDIPVLPEEIEHRLKRATEIIGNITGESPASFRCPRLFGGTEIVNALEKLRYKTDASYPVYYYMEQLEPYHPDSSDWRKKGSLDLLEIPNFADLSIQSNDEYGRDRDQWPVFRTKGAEVLCDHIENFLKYLDSRDVQKKVLCFYFHPWEFVEMPQGDIYIGEGYVRPSEFIIKNCGDFALDQLSKVIDYLQFRGASFETCEQLARYY